MKFEFTANALKCLRSLDKTIAKRILKKLDYWNKKDNPLQFSKYIKDSNNLFGFRVNDWRIIVSPNHKKGIIEILKIGHRSTIYKQL